MTIRVSADLFNLAYFAVSKEETRYYLNGVHIEPHPVKGALLVSTDGHRMVCIHDANAECDEEAIVQLPPFVRALCVAKKGKGLGVDRNVLEVSKAENRATLVIERVNAKGDVTRSDPVVTAHKVIIDGNFPDWRRVTPKGPFIAGTPAGFNPKLLAEVGQFGAKLVPSGGYSASGMYFLRSGDDVISPVVVRWGTIHHIFAVLMPMRTDIDAKLPSFLDLQPVEAVAA